MATFAASKIAYRTFLPAPTASAEAEQEIIDATQNEPVVDAWRTNAFPLLVAALPEVTQFPMRHSLVARGTAPAASPAPSPSENVSSPKPETRPPAQKQIDTSAVGRSSPAALNFPVSQPVPRKLKPNVAAPHPRADRTTPLATVFHTLQIANPARQDRTAPHSQLQTILKRL